MNATAVGDAKTSFSVTLFKVAALAERWSLSRSKLYQLMDEGRIKSVHIGASRRVPLSAVLEFEASLSAGRGV